MVVERNLDGTGEERSIDPNSREIQAASER
jgi:hypothetical protein